MSVNLLLPSYTNSGLECGLDEAGRGCLAGPVVAAAVIWPRDATLPVLNDSKQLTDLQRFRLEPTIKSMALAWAVAEVPAEEIDQINILQASLKAMHLCVDQLRNNHGLMPELLLVDGNRFKPYPFINHVCVIKGDGKYLSIAAASVLAKTYRDRLMMSLAKDYPEYGWDHNMGYPTIMHKKAIAANGLTPWHRKTFRSALTNIG
jgi:ribonuclease HII